MQVEEDTSKEEPDKDKEETFHIATVSVGGEEKQEDLTEDMADTVSAVVCNESDLKDGE
jgi:hypothetical protein